MFCAQVLAADVADGIALWERGEYSQAAEIWRPYAQTGNPEAQLYLGFHALHQQRYKAAFNWYLEAARQGLPEAQMQLGLMYEIGQGTSVDAEEAAYWYGQATGGEFCPADLPAGGALGDRK